MIDHSFTPSSVDDVCGYTLEDGNPCYRTENEHVNQLSSTWYVVVNDLIGGWDVSCWDIPASEHDTMNGQGPVAWGLGKEIAEHIVKVHNESCGYT